MPKLTFTVSQLSALREQIFRSGSAYLLPHFGQYSSSFLSSSGMTISPLSRSWLKYPTKRYAVFSFLCIVLYPAGNGRHHTQISDKHPTFQNIWLGRELKNSVSESMWVQSLVRELRSCKPHGAAKKEKKRIPVRCQAQR